MDAQRTSTGFPAMDNALGGGLVDGSMVLMAAAPGLGKSTIWTQIAGLIAHSGKKVLYIGGEETAEQIKLRCSRLQEPGIMDIMVFCETDTTIALQAATDLKPDLLIIDSINTMVHPDLHGPQGSVAQIRRSTDLLRHHAKTNGLTTILIGHVNKAGHVGGPKTLEHMVDTVIRMVAVEEGSAYRELIPSKNRFGSTEVQATLRMGPNGLEDLDAKKKPSWTEKLEVRIESIGKKAKV